MRIEVLPKIELRQNLLRFSLPRLLEAPMKFTILTPTFNRAHTLPRLYESLCAQAFRDFEWIIVDDGSSDETRELVASWHPFFPIRYYWQENSGKHVAINRGVELARGELIFQVDSDDQLLPHSLERFDVHWRNTPPGFLGVGALCAKDDGSVLGAPFPLYLQDTHCLKDVRPLQGADRCSVIDASIWKRLPFPVFAGEKFIVEGVVWNRMLSTYPCRFISEPLKIAGYAPGGLSDSGDLREANPNGAALYYRELAFRHRGIPLRERAKAVVNAAAWSFIAWLQ